MNANFPQEIYVIQVCKPILVVLGYSPVIVKANETVELGFNGRGIMIQFLVAQDFPRVGSPGRIADPGGSISHEGNSPVPRIGEMAVRKKRNRVADMCARSGGINANVKGNGSFAHEPGKPLGITALGKKASSF
jgi:hypothetical protein